MSDTATKNVPDYLREARLKAGYASRGTATTKVHIRRRQSDAMSAERL